MVVRALCTSGSYMSPSIPNIAHPIYLLFCGIVESSRCQDPNVSIGELDSRRPTADREDSITLKGSGEDTDGLGQLRISVRVLSAKNPALRRTWRIVVSVMAKDVVRLANYSNRYCLIIGPVIDRENR